ncbi:tetratricopeptide repeat protein [Aquirufa sp. ROCK2-A2]
MTSNHLLLYRHAELMLQNEQHILPVDLLFEDEQIGDFVRSIQIDSPFQQMLLEGVLTESVREEKLYVSFTVEGYFHYVLGEVIFKQTEGCGAEVLKQMVEGNKLNGLKEGIEQCLIRDVNQNDLSRLMWLIDSGGELLDLCSKPLAHTFLNIKGQINSEEELTQAYIAQIKKVTSELFADPTDNDLEALSKGIEYLEEKQKNNVIALIYQQINELIVPDNLKKSILYIKSIEHLPEAVRNDELQDLADYTIMEESELAALFYRSLGQQFSFVGNYEKAIYFHVKSLDILFKNQNEDHFSIGEAYNQLGEVLCNKGDYDEAIGHYIKSLSIRLKCFGELHYSIWESQNNLGEIWLNKGENEKAIEFLQKSLVLSLKIFGNHHPSTAITFNNLGSAWNSMGEKDLAIEFLEKSLAIRIKIFGNQHQTTGESYNNLGSVWREKGDNDKAIEYYEKTIVIDLRFFGDQHPFTALTYNNLGVVWRKKGNYKMAAEYLEKSLEINLKVNGVDNPSTAIAYTNLGNVFNEKKDLKQAKEYYEKAFKIFLESHGEDHPHTKLLIQKLNDL